MKTKDAYQRITWSTFSSAARYFEASRKYSEAKACGWSEQTLLVMKKTLEHRKRAYEAASARIINWMKGNRGKVTDICFLAHLPYGAELPVNKKRYPKVCEPLL